VIKNERLIHIPDRVIELYPRDPDLPEIGAVSYMGVPLKDLDGQILGHLAVLDNAPMPEEPRSMTVFRIFAERAAAELRRLRAEADVREREQKLGRLVDSAMDAIVELDGNFSVTMMNPAAEKLFACVSAEVVGRRFDAFLDEASRQRITRIVEDLDRRPEGQRYEWIPGSLVALRADGDSFRAEATLSRADLHGRPFYTMILRSMDERLKAEAKIRALTAEAELLREELQSLGGFAGIIGTSPAMKRVVLDIEQVAETDATVLVTGETGTGKEVIARAIHAASRRRDRPLVKVNCAAIPASLIESEFFGHEKGAFTGATQKREGRFALADTGTIFLDEIGELPLELQGKLLRVLQEGEFEPVGSSKTCAIDVRVIAATNRDLRAEVQAGRFREDLFYRLNVFQIHAPPLRERGGDVGLLATAFADTCGQRMGRVVDPPDADDIARLQVYSWPGNVRELQNVIERAIITSRGTCLNLDRAMPPITGVGERVAPSTTAEVPGAVAQAGADATAVDAAEDRPRIRTVQELHALERENILRALDASDWRVSGTGGAAELLGMKSSTLNSRMRALGIRRPRA
jgi:PAS domain S-box-containing protein